MSRAKMTNPRRVAPSGWSIRQWMTREEVRHDLLGDGLLDADGDTCYCCGEEIRMQIRRGTGFCSALCEEAWLADQQAMADYADEASEREPDA
jgi:hypothetical protein